MADENQTPQNEVDLDTDGGMKNGMPGGTMLKMGDGGMAVQSKGCGAVDNARRKPTKLR